MFLVHLVAHALSMLADSVIRAEKRALFLAAATTETSLAGTVCSALVKFIFFPNNLFWYQVRNWKGILFTWKHIDRQGSLRVIFIQKSQVLLANAVAGAVAWAVAVELYGQVLGYCGAVRWGKAVCTIAGGLLISLVGSKIRQSAEAVSGAVVWTRLEAAVWTPESSETFASSSCTVACTLVRGIAVARTFSQRTVVSIESGLTHANVGTNS